MDAGALEIGHLADEREGITEGARIVKARCPPGDGLARVGALLFEEIVHLGDGRRLKDGVGELGHPHGLGLAQMEVQALAFHQIVEGLVQGFGFLRDVKVGAAETRVVQGVDEVGADVFDEGHQRPGLGQGVVELQRFVLNGKGPLDLLVAGRPVEVAAIVGDGKGAFEPALVEPGAVGIDALDQVPGIAQGLAQLVVLGQPLGEELEHHAADGLVGMGHGKDHGRLGAAADLERLDGIALPRMAQGQDLDDVRELASQPLRTGPQFVYRQKALIVRNLG